MKSRNTLSLLINPFERIAGSKALLIGSVIFVLSVLLGYFGHVVFDGVVGVHFKNDLSLLLAFVSPIVALAIFILLLYVIGLLLGKSSIRFIDVLGTIVLARVPYLLVALVALIPGVYLSNMRVTVALVTQSFGDVSIGQWFAFILFVAVSLIAIVWFIILAYRAFSVSCNVKGAKAIIGFTVVLILSEMISTFAIYQVAKYLL